MLIIKNGKDKNSVESQNAVQKFIEKIRKLKALGVDISKMQQKDTIKTLAAKSGIQEEEVKKVGLDPTNKIGITRVRVARAYREGQNREEEQYETKEYRAGTPPTEEEVKKLLELGIQLEYRDIAQEFIEKLEMLKSIGVDVSKLKIADTIKTLAEKSEVSEEKIKKIGLNPENKIGKAKSAIAEVYRGNIPGVVPTDEQVKRLLELGIHIERVKRKRGTEELAKATISILKQIDQLEREQKILKIFMEHISERK